MHIGKIRKKLALMLQSRGFPVEPEDLRVNYYYNTKYFDACSWDATYVKGGEYYHLFSWDTMGELIKGFDIVEEGYHSYELHKVLDKS